MSCSPTRSVTKTKAGERSSSETLHLSCSCFPLGPQGEEIVRRCLYGYSPELALQTSNPIKIPPGRGGKPAGSGSVRITSEHVRNLKHDVEFIKKAHDLRDVGEGKKGKGNPKDAPPR